ncbi:serine hydrolase [Ktedonosporobacter rubrisoli]|uniref:Serine hydrolase n=1 Tax=Ktedonosporobacter rubrisoli TaxID=2509675 RepID=A0A4P6JNT6_KTERU|nr:serine hydrolase [Ktedonosporobacter rubrisoli]QBD76989.1 serine hydrolase [Ktedonosporobacter rubrisoli]
MAQTFPSASHTSALQGLEEFIETIRQEWQVPGLGIGITRDGETIFSSGFGKRNLADNQAVTPQTLFAIGSCSKAFTALALAILVDEGKLDWDTPIKQYIPTFKLADNVATEHATARDLLCHRTGLARNEMMWFNSTISRKELVDRLRYCEAQHSFRSTWLYQNMMFALAGYLVEVLSGQSWEEFVRERIFLPLGMRNSNFSVHESQQSSDFSLPYKLEAGEVKRDWFYDRFDAVGPAGSINSNIEDMLQWLRCMLQQSQYGENGQRLVSAAQFEQLITPHMIVPVQPGLERYQEEFYRTYALGWAVNSYRGHTLFTHTGGINGFISQVTGFPDDGIGVVVLTNLGDPLGEITKVITYHLADRLLGLDELNWNERCHKAADYLRKLSEDAENEPKEVHSANAPLSHPLSAYAGEYRHPGFGTFTIAAAENGLKGILNDLEYSFEHDLYDVFSVSEKTLDLACKIVFMSNIKGDIDSFSIPLDPEVSPIVFTRALANDAD